jgi:hypothetical protein
MLNFRGFCPYEICRVYFRHEKSALEDEIKHMHMEFLLWVVIMEGG